MPPLQPDCDGQSALPCCLIGRQHAPDTGRVDRHWLLHENVFASLHGVLEVERSKTGRGGQDDQIQRALQQAAIRVQSNELSVARHVHPRRVLSFDCPDGRLNAIREGVGQGNEPYVTADRIEGLNSGRRSPCAAADQTDGNRVAAKHMSSPCDAQTGTDSAAGEQQRRTSNEISTRRLGEVVALFRAVHQNILPDRQAALPPTVFRPLRACPQHLARPPRACPRGCIRLMAKQCELLS